MKEYLEVFQTIRNLKEVKRAGWALKKISNPESVADHSFQITVLALLSAEKAGLDKNKCIQMALVHDISETLAGDKTPHDNITETEKHELEKNALLKILEPIPDKNILNLWEEYENQETDEAKFVKELDKIEMLIQAHDYHKKHPECDLKEFWEHVDKKIQNPILREIFDMLPYEE